MYNRLIPASQLPGVESSIHRNSGRYGKITIVTMATIYLYILQQHTTIEQISPKYIGYYTSTTTQH
jgi:hypothetical protein